MNKGIWTALSSIVIAQMLKVPLKKQRTGEWDWKALFETGGMPSSHSAGVTSLATFIAKKKGIPTVDFALSSIFGLIVMYDAQGVRRQTGELTLKVNELDKEVEDLLGKDTGYKHERTRKKLKHMLGHQPIEVLGGAVFGMVMGLIVYYLDKD